MEKKISMLTEEMEMASRIIHLAITDGVSKSYRYKDKNRLELGSVLPDAVADGNSHMKIHIAGGMKKTYDLTGFRSRFFSEMAEDDLYMGYYLHLIQDLYFRDFIYNCYHWNPVPPGNIEKLHNDYALINQYVIRKYALADTIVVPDDFDSEPVNELGFFTIRQFISDMKTDFQRCPTGTTFFFTSAMADEFIAYAIEKCNREIDFFYHGLEGSDEQMLAWGN